MAKGFFVTGTDTGVGKTIITASLVKTAQHLGFNAIGMKPVETGCRKAADSEQHIEDSNDILIPRDGKFLQEISGIDESLDLITPFRLESPLAPLPASEIEDISIDREKIIHAFTNLAYKYKVLVVEGIGGILVPITKDYSVIDMAKDFGLPVIVVARPGLGTINHTLLTVTSALHEGLTVAGVVINHADPPAETLAEKTNLPILKKVCPVPVLGVFPYLKNVKTASLGEAVFTHLNLDILKQYLI